jgi:hypothetical protein
MLRDMGFPAEVAARVGERVLEAHRDAATLSQLTALLRGLPGIDPEVPLLFRQLTRHVRQHGRACVRGALQ